MDKPDHPMGMKPKEDFRLTPKPVLPGELHDETEREQDRTPCAHTWTELAQAREPDGYDPDPPVWMWCIRCGCLELEGAVYSPGPNQRPVIMPDKG